jgi:hypothetical protein
MSSGNSDSMCLDNAPKDVVWLNFLLDEKLPDGSRAWRESGDCEPFKFGLGLVGDTSELRAKRIMGLDGRIENIKVGDVLSDAVESGR